MNLIVVIGVYATICKELGLPLRFPGTTKSFSVLLEIVDVEILAKAMVWMSTTPKCANNAFNISNGDVFRWEGVWNRIGDFFGLDTRAYPLPIKLTEFVADKEELWASIVEKYGLQKLKLKDLVSFGFGDFVFSREYDWFASQTKIRQFGFHEVIDSEEMFVKHLQNLRKLKVIP